ncbi:UPF0390 protein zgc136864-like [Tubulanus polymorphus]|uniref:UPF0390 protein zgc136864-like n=1 Tax=Tubulanus polymorphus TaxID=672921 RepID=UPI003DA2169A
MPQGKIKVKAQLPSGTKQKSGPRKIPKLKKGPHILKPKKPRHIDGAKLKEAISKTISQNVESQVISRAATIENKSLNVLKTNSTTKKKKKS